LETGLPLAKVNELLEKFDTQYHKIACSKNTIEICIINWKKYNDSESPTVKTAIDSALKKIKDTVLIQYIYGIDRVSLYISQCSTVPVHDSVLKKEVVETETKHKYGLHKNVMLTEAEYQKLHIDLPNVDALIDRLSDYIATNKKAADYTNHNLVIRRWEKKDREEGKVNHAETQRATNRTRSYGITV